MPGRIAVACPACSAKLAVADESKLGKKLKCPKCSEIFVAKPLGGGAKTAKAPAAKPKPKPADDDEFNFDDMDMEDKSENKEDDELEDEAPAAKSKMSAKKPVKGKGKKKSSGNNMPLIIGGAAVAVVLIGVVLWMVFGGDGAAPVAQNPPPAAAPPAPAGDSPNDKILALKWLPQDTEFILHLKVANVWQAPLLQGLLASPQAAAGVAQMQQAIGLAPADLESVTIGVKNLQQLQAASAMMAFGGPPPMDAAGLIVLRSTKAVEVSQLQQMLVQSAPNQAAKLVDHGGKQLVEITVPQPAVAAPRLGPRPGPGVPTIPTPGGAANKTIGVWFANANTLLAGPSDEVKAAMDRGETVTPRNEFRAIDATPHLLFVVAPKDTSMFSQSPAGAGPQGPPAAVQLQNAMKESLTAVSFGASITGGVALQSSLVCKDSAGVAKLKSGLEALVVEGKSAFAAQKSTMPGFAAELLEMALNNVKVTEQSQTVGIATNIPDSAQDKLQQLPTMLAGMMALGGNPFGAARSGPLAIGANPIGDNSRAVVQNNLKQVALAFHNYHDTHKVFPPAAKSDGAGQPLLSWRVMVLPFLEQSALYQQFHLDEPWDSEHNKTLIDKMPAVFASPTDPTLAPQGLTRILVPNGPGLFCDGTNGTPIRDIPDGTSNTIMAVEVQTSAAVIWTKPDDLTVDSTDPLKNLQDARMGGFIVAMCDGSVRLIQSMIDPATLNALFTRKGGEPVGNF